MKTIAHFISSPTTCSYLPDRPAQSEYEYVASMTAGEYGRRMHEGWRRFGHTIFRPVCRGCSECRSLRVLVDQFRPNRSQRRVRRLNEGVIRLEIGQPAVSKEKLRLYDRYHAFQSDARDWARLPPRDESDYVEAYVNNPFPGQEYRYYLGEELVGVGLVDALPGCLSAVYCYYAPEHRARSLGTWNVLSVIEQAALAGLRYVYLGYYVAGCRSLEYKANFVPNEIRHSDGVWRAFR
jgi:arginyl-tRNA--protein-N-Asp/Glu arginylyltransferase